VENPFAPPDADLEVQQPTRRGAAMSFRAAFDYERGFETGKTAVRAAPLAMWLGGLLMLIFDSNTSGSGDDSDFDFDADLGVFDSASRIAADTTELAFPEVAELLLAGVFSGVVLLFLLGYCFIRPGFIRLCASVLEGNTGVGPLFSGADRTLPMAGCVLIQFGVLIGIVAVFVAPYAIVFQLTDDVSLLVGLGVALAIPGFVTLCYVYLGIFLAEFCLTLEGCGAVESVKRSWALTQGNRFQLLGFVFVMSLIQMAAAFIGLLMLCVGMIATLPLGRSLVGVATTESFLMLVEGEGARDRFSVLNWG